METWGPMNFMAINWKDRGLKVVLRIYYGKHISNWGKMEVPNLIVLEDLNEYTISKVLKIEEGIVENDWLIVEISFNKLYLDAKYMPYYFKLEEDWYPTTYLGVGKLDPKFQGEN